MFVKAIEVATQFTRPIHFVMRNHDSSTPYAGAATLFFVNSDGWAITCKHVIATVLGLDQINSRYAAYKSDYNAGKGATKEKLLRKQLGQKYGYTDKTPVQGLSTFVNCSDSARIDIDFKPHPDLDIALLKFKGYQKLAVSKFPTFAKSGADLKQGKSLCRLGYPFAEFTNYEYDKAADSLGWTKVGKDSTPQFPIDGMVTRHLVGTNQELIGFEMSTPGLRGQSGGPAFDQSGVVWGMQAATNHLDLDFDIVDREVLREGVPRRVNDRPFLHVGHCIHIDALKAFMTSNGVRFDEA